MKKNPDAYYVAPVERKPWRAPEWWTDTASWPWWVMVPFLILGVALMGTIPTLLVLPFVDVGARIVFAIVALAFIAYAIGEAHGSGKPFWPRVWEHLKPRVILAVILTVIVVTALWADHQP